MLLFDDLIKSINSTSRDDCELLTLSWDGWISKSLLHVNWSTYSPTKQAFCGNCMLLQSSTPVPSKDEFLVPYNIPFIHDYMAKFVSNYIYKFANDSILVESWIMTKQNKV